MPARLRPGRASLLCSIAFALPLASQSPRSVAEKAAPNDNRAVAGRLVDGVLTLLLEAREASWYPEDTAGVALPVFAFAEAGRRATVPGPLIRVPAGTEIRVTVHNTLPLPLLVRGLQDHASPVLDSIVLEPGATQALRFRADSPGTHYYWGRTGPVPANPGPGAGRDGSLVGAFIVDSAGTISRPTPGERILVITVWSDTLATLGVKSEHADRVMRREIVPRDRWFLAAVNGWSWPYTERMSYTAGDTVRWRVINASRLPHPMHLHGFYFDLEARGDALRDTVFAPAQRRKAVTEWMIAGTTMTMRWIPTRPGNWLFHCHIVTHISDALRLGSMAPSRAAHFGHAENGMAGLVTGIRVAPRATVVRAPDPSPRRKLRLFVTERANVYGDRPGYSYVLQEGPTPPAPDSIRRLSSTITLRQNEPAEITVINATRQMATIHWHGIELESFYDGVGDWSGWGANVAPPIASGDSFVVRLSPPRAGTFMYHTHTSEGIQLASGLYGALLVLPEYAPPQADTTERVLVAAIGGPLDDGRPVINGSATPPPIEIRAGVAHRFRFINISPLETRTVQLVSGDSIQQWRAVAKDGADLPELQATMQRGAFALHPGETYDFEVLRQHPESLTLKVIGPETIANRAAYVARANPREPLPRIVVEIPVIVR
jgi:FtsP/CotA-like multicopper oxidase with cupredoxin domain